MYNSFSYAHAWQVFCYFKYVVIFFIGHVYEGLKYFGFLQFHSYVCRSTSSQGTWWQKEIERLFDNDNLNPNNRKYHFSKYAVPSKCCSSAVLMMHLAFMFFSLQFFIQRTHTSVLTSFSHNLGFSASFANDGSATMLSSIEIQCHLPMSNYR